MSRLKPEALTDKESGELEVDSEEVKEEGQGGAEEGLPASQPQPSINQVLLEDEDLIIEEYISDWGFLYTVLHCDFFALSTFSCWCIVITFRPTC